jgi:hypothetical protein
LRKLLLLILLLSATVIPVLSQSITDFRLDNIQNQTLRTFLLGQEAQRPIKFFFQEEWLVGYTIDESSNGKTLRQALTDILGTDLTFTEVSGYAVVFIKDPAAEKVRDEIIRTAVEAKKEIEEKIIGTRENYKRGKLLSLNGVVKDEFTQSVLGNVIVLVDNKQEGQSDATGRYQLSLAPGNHVLEFRFVNYREKIIDLKIFANGSIDIVLEEAPVVLEEVVVSDQAIVNRQVSQTYLKISDIKRTPTFLGEVDVIKQIQNQPGVTTVGEVASGFNVRGGGVDQNLVLYDGVPIFNTSHALGFFTAFNADAVKEVSFYRGGVPAEYGGRVSSVLKITAKEGPGDRIHGDGGIGIISSYATVGVPIKRDTTSILVSLRTSYSDWMLKAIKSNYTDVSNSSVRFYDGSVKFSHKFSSKTKLTVSGYLSSDRFSFTNDTLYGPRNFATVAQLSHSFTDKLYGSFSLGYGKYSYTMTENDPENAFELFYGVSYPFLKADFNYDGSVHKFSFGMQNIYYDFEPGALKPGSGSSGVPSMNMKNERSLESALYLSDAFQWKEKIQIEGGLRLSIFNRIGDGTVFRYEENQPREPRNIVDSTTYGKGEIMKIYFGLEPRLSIRYTLTDEASVKLGYNRMYQYLHLITNTAAVTPIDIWQSSNEFFKPQIADQISIGYYRNLHKHSFEAFAEVFYKTVQNTLDFKDGASLILNRYLETSLISGKGEAYGVEFSLARIKGRLLGTLSYTYSRSWRTTNGRFSQEKINDGKAYPSNYDQPHVATFNWRYNISRRHFFSGTFTYHTGRPMSVPESGYLVDGVAVPDFSARNQYRIPDYHRLDIALIIEGNHKRKKILDGTWIISFYNVYARKNAYSVFFQDDGSGQLRPYKLSVIGTIVPSITYNFKF